MEEKKPTLEEKTGELRKIEKELDFLVEERLSLLSKNSVERERYIYLSNKYREIKGHIFVYAPDSIQSGKGLGR